MAEGKFNDFRFNSIINVMCDSNSVYTNSSGASSLAEDLYVPSDPPPTAEEYVDMMEQSNQRQHTFSGMSSAASSCSITSGTPSTDLRFGEFQLDKVASIFTPDEEETRYTIIFYEFRFQVV